MSESPLHAGLTHLPDVKGKIPGKMRKGEKMGDLRFFSSFFFVPFFVSPVASASIMVI